MEARFPTGLTRARLSGNLTPGMRPLIHTVNTEHTPESLAMILEKEPGLILLRSGCFQSAPARYSFVVARPCLAFRSRGSHAKLTSGGGGALELFGDPWRILASLLPRYEMPHDLDVPFPLGGCFGFWGYDLRGFVEPKLPRSARNDLGLPDCQVGFYPSLTIFDHAADTCHVVATGLDASGSRQHDRAKAQLEFWLTALEGRPPEIESRSLPTMPAENSPVVSSSLNRDQYLAAVIRAKRYIRNGDIYQVNLSHRLESAWARPAARLFHLLSNVSPAPYAALFQGDDFTLASASPEQFLRFSGRHIQTRPIKGTRPRASDPTRDAQLSYELQTSSKELAELVMITDLLRNDLGKVCEYGSVQTPELARLERYAQVQHLVSTVEGRLRPETTHLAALASCFPGGSITGAPKFRAMEIIDELEPVSRGSYTGALGYLGFNHESQFSILIRTAVCHGGRAYFHTGAGIVADSDPEAEYLETLAKAQGFLECLGVPPGRELSRTPALSQEVG